MARVQNVLGKASELTQQAVELEDKSRADLDSAKAKLENLTQNIKDAEAAKEEARQKGEEAKRNIKLFNSRLKETKSNLDKAQKTFENASKERERVEAEEENIIRNNAPKHYGEKEPEIAGKPVSAISSSNTFEGLVKLTVALPADQKKIKSFEDYLGRIENLHKKIRGGSEKEGIEIIVSVEKPLPLLKILGKFELVQTARERSGDILIKLK